MIEYALMQIRKKKSDQIEEELNTYVKKGWRVKEMNESLILLQRKIKVQEED